MLYILNVLIFFVVNFSPSSAQPPGTLKNGRPTEPVIFDIFHNGQTTDVVVVGSRITLTFTPYFAIPREFILKYFTLFICYFWIYL